MFLSRFKRTINCSKYQPKVSPEGQNQYLVFLIDPSFQGENILFVLLFENVGDRKVHTGYYLPKVEKAFLISQLKVIREHMITFQKLKQVKEMITQLVVGWIIVISISIIK